MTGTPPGIDPALWEQQRQLNKKRERDRIKIVVGIVAALVVIGGIGSLFGLGDTEPTSDRRDDDTTAAADPTPDESGLPACDDIWQVGENLPDPYEGCRDGDTDVAPTLLDCENGNGQYAQSPDETSYARAGAPVIDTTGPLARICDEGNETGDYAIPHQGGICAPADRSQLTSVNVDRAEDELTVTFNGTVPAAAGTTLYSLTAGGLQFGAKWINGDPNQFIFDLDDGQTNLEPDVTVEGISVTATYIDDRIADLGETFEWTGTLNVDGADVATCGETAD